MNVKMLLFPLAVVIGLAVAILYVQPAYQSMQTHRTMLMQKQKVAESIGQKVRNAKALENDLNAKKTEEASVLQYVSETRQDDRIINTLNALAGQSNVVLVSLGMESNQTSDEETSPTGGDVVPLTANLLADPPSMSVDPMMGGIAEVAVAPVKPKGVDVNVRVVGSYESVKDFSGRVARFDRFSHIASIKIDHANGNGEGFDPNILQADIMLSVSYLPRLASESNSQSLVFDRSTFNLESVSKLAQKIIDGHSIANVEVSGSSNPFLVQ